jgi:putative lipoic acid-binding regulatory protein
MNTNTPAESLIQYPCDFPIKVMGKATPEFLPAVIHVAKQFDPITVHVTSREQLDEIYRTLSTHPLVSVVL